jgi:hypothetical protein
MVGTPIITDPMAIRELMSLMIIALGAFPPFPFAILAPFLPRTSVRLPVSPYVFQSDLFQLGYMSLVHYSRGKPLRDSRACYAHKVGKLRPVYVLPAGELDAHNTLYRFGLYFH